MHFFLGRGGGANKVHCGNAKMANVNAAIYVRGTV